MCLMGAILNCCFRQAKSADAATSIPSFPTFPPRTPPAFSYRSRSVPLRPLMNMCILNL